MATVTSAPRPTPSDEGVTLVDPRAPRFGQSITTLGLLLGIVLQAPVFVFAVAVVLNTAVWSRWRLHPYSLLWRYAVAPRVDAAEPEPAAPHRFATTLGAVGTGLGSIAILAGLPLLGYVLAAGVAAAAGLAAVTGLCIGCRMYQSVALFRRLDIV